MDAEFDIDLLLNIVSQFDYVEEMNQDNFDSTLTNLLQGDINNSAIVEVESGDEDLDLDMEDDMATMNISLVNSPQEQNYLDVVFCVTQSYVIVQTARTNTLCHFCYYIHQYYLNSQATHNHVNTHVKRRLRYSNLDVYCVLCLRPLYQIILPKVCLHCNVGTRLIEVDWDSNIPIIP